MPDEESHQSLVGPGNQPPEPLHLDSLPGRPEEKIIRGMDERILQSSDPREMAVLTRIRGELLRQNREDRAAVWDRQRFIITIFLALALVVVGASIMIFYGTANASIFGAAIFILAVGLYLLAPTFVSTVLERLPAIMNMVRKR